MDQSYGRRNWLLVYGGDPFNANKPDVAHIARYFQDKFECKLLAVQCTELLQYGGVDAWVEYVYYYPTDKYADPHKGKNPLGVGPEADQLSDEDNPSNLTVWGGYDPENQGR